VTEAAESPLLIGQRVSHYRILKQLEAGGMGRCTGPKKQISDDMLR
jgi:hypothetical protein